MQPMYNLPPANWHLVDKIALGTQSAHLESLPWKSLGKIWEEDDGVGLCDTQVSILMELNRVDKQPRCPLTGGNVRHGKHTYGYVQGGEK